MPDDDRDRLRDLSSPAPDAVVRYAAHDDGLIDVHLPAARSPRPRLLLLLHGGFWKQAYDRRHTRAAASALAREGFVVATPEYRRVGGGGGWPATAQDADLAVVRAPDLLRGLGIPTAGTTVVGHSAGGQLALWLATRPHPCDLVVGLAPVADLRAAARLQLGDRATQALLRGEPQEVPRAYDEADPATRLAHPPRCPIRIVHGAADHDVPLSLSHGLAAAHPWVSLDAVPGAGHLDLVQPGSAAWPAVLAAVRGS